MSRFDNLKGHYTNSQNNSTLTLGSCNSLIPSLSSSNSQLNSGQLVDISGSSKLNQSSSSGNMIASGYLSSSSCSLPLTSALNLTTNSTILEESKPILPLKQQQSNGNRCSNPFNPFSSVTPAFNHLANSYVQQNYENFRLNADLPTLPRK